MLCPVEALHAPPQTSSLEELLSYVVQRFQVSPTVATIQLCEAGLISEETKEELKSYSTKLLASQFGWKPTTITPPRFQSCPVPPRGSLPMPIGPTTRGSSLFLRLPSLNKSALRKLSTQRVARSAHPTTNTQDKAKSKLTWTSLITHGHVKVLEDDYERLLKQIRLFF